MLNPFPQYLKKEEAKIVLPYQKRVLVFIMMGYSLILGYTSYCYYPTMNNLYSVFHYQIPPESTNVSYMGYALAVMLVVLAAFIYFSQILDNEFYKQMNQYKDGEMIARKDLMSGAFNRIFILLIVMVGIFFIGSLAPAFRFVYSF